MRLIAAIAICIFSINSVFAGDAKISGKITNKLADEVQVSYYTNLLDYSQKTQTAKVSEDGSFSITVPVTEQYLQIQIQNGDQATETFIQSGDDLKLTVDGKNFDSTLKYTGKGAAVSNMMAKHVLQYSMMIMFGSRMQQHYIKEQEEFISAANDEMKKELDFLESNKKGVPESFVQYWKAWYQYSVYDEMIRYTFMHKMMKERTSSVIMRKKDYAILDKVPVAFNDNYVSIPGYVSYVAELYTNKYSAMTDDDTTTPQEKKNELRETYVNKQVNANMPPKTKEYYYAKNLYDNIKYSPVADVEKRYAGFLASYKNSSYDTILSKAVAIKRKKAKGAPAIEFDFTTMEGQQMKLSDLKGKVVYIDFWASWCGPCMRELPATKKVKEHFKDKDVVFLNVSIDDDMAAWKKAIEKNNITGIHTCEPGGWKSRIAQLYGVNSVPSYFLIDRNGKFASENTPRPSETEQLIKEIEAVLQ